MVVVTSRCVGLHYEDLIRESAELALALDRAPREMTNARTVRTMVALDLSCKHDVLPEEQWTKVEDDAPVLRPYIEEARAELDEKLKWPQ